MKIRFLRDYPTKTDLGHDPDNTIGAGLKFTYDKDGKPVSTPVKDYVPYKPKYKKGDVSTNFSPVVISDLLKAKAIEVVYEPEK